MGVRTSPNASIFVLFCFVYLFYSSSYVQTKTVIGFLDKANVNTDWKEVGSFTFSIPQGAHGYVESDVVVDDGGHNLLLLTEEEKQFVLTYPGLQQFYAPQATHHWHRLRQLSPILPNTREPNAAAASQTATFSFHNARSLLDVNATRETALPTGPTLANNTDAVAKNVSLFSERTGLYVKGANSDFKGVGIVHLESSNLTTTPREISDVTTVAVPLPVADPVIVIQPSHAKAKLKANSVCDAFVETARVSEKLKTLGPRLAYHTILFVEPHISDQNVVAIITRCNSTPFVPYRLVFKNPGGLLKMHFSYEDQGLLQLFLLTASVCSFLIYWYRDLKASILHAKKEYPVVNVVLVATVSLLFFVASECAHLLMYAYDGIGLPVFSFLASLADLLFTTATACALLSILFQHTSNVSRLSENRDSQAFGSEHTSASNLCFFPVTPRDPDFKHFRPISWLSNLTYYLHSTFNVLTAAFSSAESLLYCLALSLFVITMICSLRYRSFHKSLTPGRHFFQLRESATTHGFVLLLFILVYFASRFLLACIIVKITARLLNRSKDNHASSSTFIFAACSFFWLVSLPTVAFFCSNWTFLPHFQLTTTLAANVGICVVLWKFVCYRNVLNKPEAFEAASTPIENQQLVMASSWINNRDAVPFPTASAVDYDTEKAPDLVDVAQFSRPSPAFPQPYP